MRLSKITFSAVGILGILLIVSGAMFATNSTSGSAFSTEIEPASIIVANFQPQVACGTAQLCPSFLDQAYSFNSLQSKGVIGEGQTIVIADACGDAGIKSDLKTFDAQWGLGNPTLNVIDVQGIPSCTAKQDPLDWSAEISLDVEWAHVVAPGATIDLLVTAKPNSSDLYGAWSYALENNLGYQISNSWGGSGGCTVTSLLANATKDHVTVLASAGDSGAWGKGTTQTQQAPADCRNVLTVGGTTLHVTPTGAYKSESAWNEGGGGYSAKTSESAYQSLVKITDPYGTLAKPDVSADANPNTGVLVYNAANGGWLVVGGTSVSCPLWAGFMADVNQIRATDGFSPAGLVNKFLYEDVYGVSGTGSLYALDFHDITTGNNGWPAGVGWDAATGLGSFNATTLADTLGSNASA